MSKSNFLKTNEKIAETVTGAFAQLEEGVLNGYTKVEDAVVSRYTKIEDAFVARYLSKDGESVEEAKARIKRESSLSK